ncbi:MAG: ABC transporter permease [Thermoplasmatota archaeon]
MSLKKALSVFSEIMLMIFLLALILVVIFGLYFIPGELKPFVTVIALVLLLVTIFWIVLLAFLHRLQFKMGFRNLIRHKGDTVIAIFGFMVGTSIICSSMAIGDTMGSMIEDLVYDAYYLTDEYMVINDGNGDPIDINGTLASEISDIAWKMESEDLIDGVSWEYQKDFSVVDNQTMLFEPVVTCRALNPSTYDGFGSITSSGSTLSYDLGPDEAYMGKDLSEKLESGVGSVVTVMAGMQMKEFRIVSLVDENGRGASLAGADLYLSFSSIWGLSNVTPEEEGPVGDGRNWEGGIYNILLISNEGGVVEGGDLCSEVVDRLEEDLREIEHPLGGDSAFEFSETKKSSVEMSKDGMEMFTTMFLVLGTFSIIAGITLIINIFVMLSEERREEMGISRAVGMKGKHLRLMYLFEGTIYSLISSFVGVILGIVSGLGIIWGLNSIFRSMGVEGLNLLENYTVTPLSMVLSFVAGFTITITTTLFITRRVAKLNIVSAIRSTPVPLKRPFLVTFTQKLCGVYNVRTCSGDGSPLSKIIQYMFDKTTMVGFYFIILGIPIALIGILLKMMAPTSLGISMLLIGLALVIKYFTNARITYTIAGILVLIFWIVPLPVFEDFSGDLEMFILSGIFMVTSGVLLLVWNTDIILWVVERIVSLIGLAPSTIKMAVSYPIKKRFRTGVTIFMFALIIFTITGMSMIVHILNVNIEGFEKTLGGGYSIIGVSNMGIDDLETAVLEGESFLTEDVDVYARIDWDNTVSMTSGVLVINRSYTFQGMEFEDVFPYPCNGVNNEFIEKNTYGFSTVDWSLVHPEGNGERTDREVWKALERNPDLVVLDGMMGGDSPFGPAGQPGIMEVGDVIELEAVGGLLVNKTIVGFTEQIGINGVFMYNSSAESDFGVTEKKIHLFTLKSEGDEQEIANDIKRSLLRYGLFTFIIKDIIEEILEAQNAFFNLFNAFLSLGLVIGIVGLGIITLRSVYERRHEIGMMRAIGFKRKAVIASFLGESAFISGSGLIIGSVLGIILGWMLWRDSFGETMTEFGVPWVKILVIAGIALLFALLACIPPSFRASRVTPAEALRYE